MLGSFRQLTHREIPEQTRPAAIRPSTTDMLGSWIICAVAFPWRSHAQ
jgi:hypothetical protein